MKFLDRLKAAVKITLGELPRNYYFGLLGGANSMKRSSVEADPYGNLVSWVYFAIDKVAQRVGGINLELYQLQKNGDVSEITDHELLNLLYRANPTQTKFELFYLSTLYLRIWGSSPWYLETNGKKILNIWPLRPDLLRVLQNKDGTITGYEYRVGTLQQTFKAEEIINIRKPSPQNPLLGFSVLLATALEIDADVAAAVWNKHILENSAEPGGVLTTSGELSDEQYSDIKQKWESRYAGPTNSGRTAILEAGLQYQKISQTQQELDFIESRKFNRDSILTMLGVPKALVIADDVNRANAEVAERVFAKETVDPLMRLIIDQLNEFFVNKFGDNLWLDFENVRGRKRNSIFCLKK
jgi:HK97 family phage portal protein